MYYICFKTSSNNTNKLSPQEPAIHRRLPLLRSNNTNKLSPQELFSNSSANDFVQIIQINLVLKNSIAYYLDYRAGSNNTNKLSPQEQSKVYLLKGLGSNNTNKLSPQEPFLLCHSVIPCSNNTNKLSPQEPHVEKNLRKSVQIIQINLVLKNFSLHCYYIMMFK